MRETAPETPASSTQSLADQERVESWKGIAVYLGREVRTVQRWEKQEGLPVHRHIHNKLSTVYAFKSELDGWWHDRGIKIDNRQTEAAAINEDRAGRWLTLERLGFLLLLAATLGAWLLWPRSTVQVPLRRFAFSPSEPVSWAQISPNGKHIVYTTERKTRSPLWVQDLDRVEPRRLSETDGAQFPFWSPDSQFIGYGTTTELRSIPVTRGYPATICQLPVKDEPFLGGTWSQTGQTIIFTQPSRRFFEVPARGGTPRVMGEIDASTRFEHVEFPQLLPRAGRQLLFMFKQVGQPHSFGLFSAESSKHEVLVPMGPSYLCPVYSETGHILFSFSSEEWNQDLIAAIPFSASSGKVTGAIFQIATNGNFPSTSKDGTLVYVENTALWPPGQLVWRDRNGRRGGMVGQVPLATHAFALSPDQHKLLSNRFSSPQLVVRDLVSAAEFSLPTSGSRQFGAVWAPDGNELTFAGVRGSSYDIVVQPANPNGEETVLWATEADEFPSDWSSDGKFLIYSADSPKSPWDVWYLKRKDDWQGYEAFPFLQTQHKERNPKFSPDGHFVVFSSDESGRSEVYMTRFPENAGKMRISKNGGYNPCWSKDGTELYYVEGQTLIAVPVGTEPEKILGSPLRLFDDPSLKHRGPMIPFVVSSDRQRFLLKEPTGDAPPPVIRVVQHWYSEFTAHD